MSKFKLWSKYMILVGLATGSIGLIQATEILMTGDTSGISILAWSIDLVICISWGAHGLKLKDKPLMLSSTLGTVGSSGVLILCLVV